MTALRQRMIKQMILKGYTANTQKTYLHHVYQLAKYYHKSPDCLCEDDIQNYLLYCHTDKHWAFSTCRQFIHAIQCLFKQVLHKPITQTKLPFPPVEQKIPELLSRNEVYRIIQACANLKHQTALKMIYATGLRISELVTLRVRDLDGERNTIHIVNAKGHKDRFLLLQNRYTPHPCG